MLVKKSKRLGKGIDKIYSELEKGSHFDVEGYIRTNGEEVVNQFEFS